MRVEGVGAQRAVEVEVEALAGGGLGHRRDGRLGLGQRHAVLRRDQLGVAGALPGRRARDVAWSGRARSCATPPRPRRGARTAPAPTRSGACRCSTTGRRRRTRSRPSRFLLQRLAHRAQPSGRPGCSGRAARRRRGSRLITCCMIRRSRSSPERRARAGPSARRSRPRGSGSRPAWPGTSLSCWTRAVRPARSASSAASRSSRASIRRRIPAQRGRVRPGHLEVRLAAPRCPTRRCVVPRRSRAGRRTAARRSLASNTHSPSPPGRRLLARSSSVDADARAR